MKVGIVSFCDSRNNYGQLLQCWALQQVLRKLGHVPYHIRYDYRAQRPGKLRQFLNDGLVKSLIHRVLHHKEISLNKHLRMQNAISDRQRDFEGFMTAHLAFAPEVYHSIEQLRNNPPQAEAYITGSDQVWSMLPEADYNKAFYLDFGDEKALRLSYAASFGRSVYPAELLPVLRNLLSNFDGISVRENSGVDICAQAGAEAVLALDPTLLLSDSDYKTLGSAQNEHASYVMIYSINIEHPEQMDWEGIREYAGKQGLDVRCVSSTGHLPAREIFDGAIYSYPEISQWISLVRSASMMFTTSFHGVVFSILTHTNFVYYPLEGKYSGGNSRVADLLAALSLEDHIWKHGMDYAKVQTPDWTEVDKRLDVLRKSSIDFLNEKLTGR